MLLNSFAKESAKPDFFCNFLYLPFNRNAIRGKKKLLQKKNKTVKKNLANKADLKMLLYQIEAF